MQMDNQTMIRAFCVVVPGATVRVTAVPLIAVGTRQRSVAATAAFGSVSAWTAYNFLSEARAKLKTSFLLRPAGFSFIAPAAMQPVFLPSTKKKRCETV
jgi:hypothetical protein